MIAGANRYTEQAAVYLEGFGGRDNIDKVTNCATRLRITVKDQDKCCQMTSLKALVPMVSFATATPSSDRWPDVPQVREQLKNY